MMANKSCKSLFVKSALSAIFSLSALSGTVSAENIQVGFSPEGSAQELVVNVIHSAHHDIRMMGYSFTAPDIVRALVDAKRRGVDVRIVLDKKGNKGKASMAAMNIIAEAGIPLRTDDAYKIQHDKVIVIDGTSFESGSFNYTTSAEKSNSENALAVWNEPAIARQYLAHWQSRWDQGHDYRTGY